MARSKAGELPQLRKHGHRAYATFNGQRRYFGRWGTPESKAAFLDHLRSWNAYGKTEPVDPEELTVAELCDKYLTKKVENRYIKNGRPTSQQSIIKIAIGYTIRLYGDSLASEFEPLKLDAVRQSMIDNNVSRTSINKFVREIVRAFRWAETFKLIPRGTHAPLFEAQNEFATQKDAREATGVHVPTKAEFDEVVKAMPQVLADLFRLQYLCGSRPSELLKITPGAIDQSDPDCWAYDVKDHKNAHREGQYRVLLFGPEQIKILRPYMLRNVDAPMFSPRECYAQRKAIQADPKHGGKGRHRRENQKRDETKTNRTIGNAYNKDSLNRALKTAIRDANKKRLEDDPKAELIKAFGPNAVRHLASDEVKREHGPEANQAFMGHKSIDTQTHYTKHDRAKAREVALSRIG